jgi:hypothetical protein
MRCCDQTYNVMTRPEMGANGNATVGVIESRVVKHSFDNRSIVCEHIIRTELCMGFQDGHPFADHNSAGDVLGATRGKVVR